MAHSSGPGGPGAGPGKDGNLLPRELLATMVEAAPTALAALDSELRFLVTNARWRRDFPPPDGEELLGRALSELLPEIPAELQVLLERSLAGEACGSPGIVTHRPDGTWARIQWDLTPWRAEDDAVAGVVLHARHQQHLHAAPYLELAENQALRDISQAIPELLYVRDVKEQRPIFSNRDLADLLRIPESERPADSMTLFRERLHPDDGPALQKLMASWEEADADTRLKGEYRLEDVDGNWRWFEGEGVPLALDEDGSVRLIAGTTADVTERREAEQALRRSEEQWRTFTANFPDYYVKVDREGRFLYSNRVDPTVTYEQLLQATTFDFVHPDYHQGMRDRIEKVWEERETADYDYPAILEDGEHWYRTRLFPIVEDDEVVAIGQIAVEITDRKRAEVALQRNEERWTNFIQNFPHYFSRISLDGTILSTNRVDPALGTDDLAGTSAYDLLPPEAAEVTRSHLEAIARTGEPATYEIRAVFPDGEHWYRSSMWPVREKGEVVAADYISIEITDQVRLETQLRHAQKMQAIGELAGGVAHDFNNLLVGVLGSSDLLLTSMREQGVDPDLQSYARTIRKASLRAADLTAQLLAFSRKGVIRREAVDLHQQVDEVMRLLGHTIDRKIEIERRLEAEGPVVLGDPSQLQNALLNLAVNARDAMPEGGTLAFGTRVRKLDASEAEDRGLEHAGEYVELSIEDSGTGIPEDHLDRVFEPFFTTKNQGEGTGLGLAAVYGTVQSHKGSVEVESVPGAGSVFRILLPRSSQEEVSPGPLASQLVAGEGRILLIDDEELVRVLGTAILKRLGYEVLVACDGEEGLEIFQRNRGSIDAIVLDLIMPRIDGRETLVRLRELDADVPVLVSSGFADADRDDDFLLEAADGFLRKPYLATEFSRSLAEVLTSRRKR